jgi:hypothetical protein
VDQEAKVAEAVRSCPEQGMRHLPATFTPGTRLGPGLDQTIEAMQRACDEQRLAEPVTVRRASAEIVP